MITIIPEFNQRIRLFDTEKMPYIIEEGERAAEEQIPYYAAARRAGAGRTRLAWSPAQEERCDVVGLRGSPAMRAHVVAHRIEKAAAMHARQVRQRRDKPRLAELDTLSVRRLGDAVGIHEQPVARCSVSERAA